MAQMSEFEDPQRKAMLSLMGGTAQDPAKVEGQPGAELAPPTAIPVQGADPNQGEVPPGLTPPPAGGEPPPDYTSLGKYADRLGVFSNSDKFKTPWDQRSERYKMLTAQSHFNPDEGVTPEMIAVLNSLNINGAKFGGGKDKLDATGLKNWENYDGREGSGDIIQGFNDPSMAGKHTWGAWAPEGPSPNDPAKGTIPGSEGDLPNAQLLQNVNSGVPTDNTFFQKLLDQARGIAGPASTDRKALLSLMK